MEQSKTTKVFIISCDSERLSKCQVYTDIKNKEKDGDFDIEVIESEKDDNRIKGCYDGHYKAAKRANELNIDYYICMEDNISYNNYEYEGFIKTIKLIKDEGLDFVYLARMPRPFFNYECRKYKKNIYKSYCNCNGTVAYIINKEKYNEFLKEPYDKTRMPVDYYFKRTLLENDYFIYPTPFKRSTCGSFIGYGGFQDYFRKIYYNEYMYKTLESTEINVYYFIAILIVIILLIIIVINM